MAGRGALWRIVRPLREGATAGWMRLYYDHLYEMCFVAQSLEDVAKIAIRHAHETFRSEFVAVAVQEGDHWNVLPYRQNDTVALPLHLPLQSDPDGLVYEPGHVVDIPDLKTFVKTYGGGLDPLVARGVTSVVSAAFGSRIHKRGYISFASTREQHYSEDEYRLMCLHALAVGIGLDQVGRAS